MSVKIREKKGRLYLDVYLKGKRTWEALNLIITKDREQNKEIWRLAEICRSQRETQLLTGLWDIQDPVLSKITLLDFLNSIKNFYSSPKTLNSLIYHLKRFANGAIIQVCQITPKWVKDFQEYFMAMVRKNELSQTSAAGYIKLFRAALKKSIANNIILRDPAVNIPTIKALDIEIIFLNIDELQALAGVKFDSSYGAEVRRAFFFACYTGLRVSDIETLTWARIETNPPQIIKRQVKTNDPVYIPLNTSAQKIIMDGKEHDLKERVFNLTGHNRRLSYNYLNKWTVAADVKKHISWHTSRRTFATLALENGVDPITVAKLLGHKDLDQVMKYAKATDKLKRKAIDSLPEIDI
jgi:integrase